MKIRRMSVRQEVIPVVLGDCFPVFMGGCTATGNMLRLADVLVSIHDLRQKGKRYMIGVSLNLLV